MQERAGYFYPPEGRIALVASRFNAFMVDLLLEGAQDMLLRHGVAPECLETIRVPGAFELPLACQAVAETARFVGIVALGVVIRGETAHFEYVAGSCAQGLQQVQLKTGLPIAFGVITTEDRDQAIARSGSTAGNKGAEAALALMEMIDLLSKLERPYAD